MGKVINFHEVTDRNWFDRTIFFLKDKYRIVSPGEFEDLYNNSSLSGVCLITVDDGASSFYINIYPVLKKYNLPAILFVSPEIILQRKNFWFQEIAGYEDMLLKKIYIEVIDKDFNLHKIGKFPIEHLLKCLKIVQIWKIINLYRGKYNIEKKKCINMSVDEIREVEQSGLVTIGAHTLSHPVLANENEPVARNEIISSFRDLEKILRHKIIYFAYPNGIPGFDYGEREVAILKAGGCRMAFTTVTGNTMAMSDLLNIPRYGLTCGDSREYIQARFFFGSMWNRVMRLKQGNEIDNRRSIIKILNLSVQ